MLGILERDDWIVANLESDTLCGRTGWIGSGAPGARYAGTRTGAGAGMKNCSWLVCCLHWECRHICWGS
jgi:hypothetical protein